MSVRATVQMPDFGGSGMFVKFKPRLNAVRSEVQNEPVLAALRRLSGTDRGFSKQAWGRWWRETGRATARQQEQAQVKARPPRAPEPKPRIATRPITSQASPQAGAPAGPPQP